MTLHALSDLGGCCCVCPFLRLILYGRAIESQWYRPWQYQGTDQDWMGRGSIPGRLRSYPQEIIATALDSQELSSMQVYLVFQLLVQIFID